MDGLLVHHHQPVKHTRNRSTKSIPHDGWSNTIYDEIFKDIYKNHINNIWYNVNNCKFNVDSLNTKNTVT